MSGGAFDYRQYQVRDLADDIRRAIAGNGQEGSHGRNAEYPPDIIERFEEAAYNLERAAEMAQRVDWLLSGDDGEKSFRRRWDKEVRKPYQNKL